LLVIAAVMAPDGRDGFRDANYAILVDPAARRVLDKPRALGPDLDQAVATASGAVWILGGKSPSLRYVRATTTGITVTSMGALPSHLHAQTIFADDDDIVVVAVDQQQQRYQARIPAPARP
jgi:hypothetical protein